MNCPVFLIIIVHLYVCIQENYRPTDKIVLATRVRTIIALTMDLVNVRFSLLNISKTRLLFDFWVPMAKWVARWEMSVKSKAANQPEIQP